MQRELLKQNQRRHSLNLGENALGRTALCHDANSNHVSHDLEIDQKVSLESLQKLKLAFEEYEMDGSRSLDEKSFGLIVKKCLGQHNTNNSQIQDLFMKIDYMRLGKIAWDEFCTYMQLEYSKREECALRRKQAAFSLPAKVRRPLTHGEPVLRIHTVSDGTVVTLREDGAVQYWSPDLHLQKTKASVFHERAANRKPKYATDLIPMTQYNKLIIATGDREIQLYELSSLEAYCQISGLETLPLMVDYCYTGADECCVLYGDCQGCVNIILMSSVGETLRLWKNLPKTENVPTITLEHATMSSNVTFIRWKAHQDWVTKVKYFPNFSAVVSSSNDEASSVVIGCVQPSTNVEQKMKEITEGFSDGKAKKVQLNWTPQPRATCDQTVFSAYKGVKTYDLCKKHNLLVTGGMDRLIRLWNPYVPGKPTGILKGHSAPIFYLCISSEDGQIFSVSMDNTVKIWDIQDQCCLFTAQPKASLIHGDLSACLYSPFMKALFIAADHVSLLSLKTRRRIPGHVIASHSEPVLCCGYSKELRQVVSCSEGSVVKVWNFDTGRQVFEFGEAHGPSAVTCMTFDPQGRRLITGGRDGCLKIWNFNNGQCLKILRRGKKPRNGERQEICDCAYLKIHRNDSPNEPRQLQRPQPAWPDDLRSGHKEDILCIAQCPPALLATSSYDGEILVWNAVSGHIQCRFRSPGPPGHSQAQGLDSSVLTLIFLRSYTADAESPSVKGLLSSGTTGYVHFWNVQNGGKLTCCFKVSERQITKLTTAEESTVLYAADQVGYIYVYNIQTLSQDHKPPRAKPHSLSICIASDRRQILIGPCAAAVTSKCAVCWN
ncbi:WD repeat-containing protein 49 [Merluccius polli]|uniref:WD repeat-containing protein 49 n=1 Tax=Merluccius polli TaxID=89951 RepID=A0AA47MNF1_MERPO|nr:WD repeat-containing protein 49 [Merluccius polli]